MEKGLNENSILKYSYRLGKRPKENKYCGIMPKKEKKQFGKSPNGEKIVWTEP